MPKISLVWLDDKFTVELCAADRRTLEKAREIGKALDAMKQDVGQPLVDAIDAITNADADAEEIEKPF